MVVVFFHSSEQARIKPILPTTVALATALLHIFCSIFFYWCFLFIFLLVLINQNCGKTIRKFLLTKSKFSVSNLNHDLRNDTRASKVNSNSDNNNSNWAISDCLLYVLLLLFAVFVIFVFAIHDKNGYQRHQYVAIAPGKVLKVNGVENQHCR